MNEQADLTASLLQRLRAGDEQAGRLLDELYRQRIRAYCQGFLGSHHAAEDAVQEVFCKVLEARAVPSSFRAWLYRVTRNHCLDLLRAGRVRKEGPEPIASSFSIPASRSGPLTRLVKAERHAELLDMLASLSDAQQEVLHLRFDGGLRRAEIAEVLELPLSVVKSRLFEGMDRLRKLRRQQEPT